MTFRDSFNAVRQKFFDYTNEFFKSLARAYGFPENPGMKVELDLDNATFFWVDFVKRRELPDRKMRFPPHVIAKNFYEIFLGDFPEATPVKRNYYQSKTDGFFSFYVERFSSSYCLPDVVSEFLQIQLGFCRDLSFIELCRDTIFGVFVVYFHLISLRLLLGWFISINPYTFPLAYYIALIDWFEEFAAQYIPALNGIPLANPLFMFLLGKLADVVNNLVITIPFLPSEGINAKTLIKGQVRPIKVFRYLPVLWYKYPIPNEIREYWFTERTDILEYLLKAYKNTNIQFLPDNAVQEVQHLTQSIVNITSITLPSDINLSDFLQI